jgi:hypothetical protein
MNPIDETQILLERESQGTKNASWIAWVQTILRWVLFLTYFVFSFVLLNMIRDKAGCFVQHTYRQEFMANVVSNPMYSSTAIVRDAPLSGLEMEYYNASEFHQRGSDIAMFPNVILNPMSTSAFLQVFMYPHAQVAAGETIPASPAALDEKTIYFHAETNKVYVNGKGPQGGATSAILNTMTDSIHGNQRAGMLLPNLWRCMDAARLPKEEDLFTSSMAVFTDWMADLGRLQQNSHLRGTCLLSGIQGTVDMSSNYKTSAILFSSVNVIFMVLLITWISASFALFNIGGIQKMLASTGNDEYWYPSVVANVLIGVSILWNFLGIVFILIPAVRINSSIPANNAIIGVVLLVASILVQWRWANFHDDDIHTTEHSAETALQNAKVVEGVPVNAYEEQQDAMASAPDMPRAEETLAAGSIFSTANFLSTASAVKNYGVDYVRQVTGAPYNAQGLRKRNGYSINSRLLM